jgi:Holliday junction resolvase RusA-like endonuclease
MERRELGQATEPEGLSFFVHGIPAPKGSFRYFKGRVIKDNQATYQWEAAVADQARAEMLIKGVVTLVGPVEVRIVVVLPRQTTMRAKCATCNGRKVLDDGTKCSACKGKGKVGKPRRSHSQLASVSPDLDKLERSTFDALSGVVFEDDSRIVMSRAMKVYDDGLPPGALIQVEPVCIDDVRGGLPHELSGFYTPPGE